MNLTEARRLIFSGGGLRGIAYVGALLAIKDRLNVEPCDLPELQECVGCSIGSLVAALICMRFTVTEMHSFLMSVDLHSMFGVSYESIITTFAVNDGAALQEMVSKALAYKGFQQSCTLAEFQKKCKLQLRVAITDLTNAKYVLASAETMPLMPVATALVASMSLPPLFGPKFFNGILYSDGGLMNSFPFDNRPGDIGMKLTWYVESSNPMDNIISYYTRVLSCLQIPHETTDVQSNVFHIDVGNFSAFKLEAGNIHEHILRLILNGYRQVNLQIDNRVQSVPDPLKYLNG